MLKKKQYESNHSLRIKYLPRTNTGSAPIIRKIVVNNITISKSIDILDYFHLRFSDIL
ncbi:Hypothetical protein FKW44_001733, partial [Caligus rogercresseyi]